MPQGDVRSEWDDLLLSSWHTVLSFKVLISKSSVPCSLASPMGIASKRRRVASVTSVRWQSAANGGYSVCSSRDRQKQGVASAYNALWWSKTLFMRKIDISFPNHFTFLWRRWFAETFHVFPKSTFNVSTSAVGLLWDYAVLDSSKHRFEINWKVVPGRMAHDDFARREHTAAKSLLGDLPVEDITEHVSPRWLSQSVCDPNQ